MRWLLAALLLLALPAACAEGGPDAPAGAPIEPAELAARIAAGDAPIILDVRTPDEFALHRIPGAVNVPHDTLAARLPQLALPDDAEIVVHCARGGRAAAAEAVLREAGHSNVRDLTGHMQAWREGGHPLE